MCSHARKVERRDDAIPNRHPSTEHEHQSQPKTHHRTSVSRTSQRLPQQFRRPGGRAQHLIPDHCGARNARRARGENPGLFYWGSRNQVMIFDSLSIPNTPPGRRGRTRRACAPRDPPGRDAAANRGWCGHDAAPPTLRVSSRGPGPEPSKLMTRVRIPSPAPHLAAIRRHGLGGGWFERSKTPGCKPGAQRAIGGSNPSPPTS